MESITQKIEGKGIEAPLPKEIIGMGLVIIHAKTGRVLGIRERTANTSTGKKAGQWSIPLERRKVDESAEGNMLGALAEAFDDEDVNGDDVRAYLTQHLLRYPDQSPFSRIRLSNGGSFLNCDYMLLIHTGDDDALIQPFNALEVGDACWVSPESLLEDGDEVRPLARRVIEEVLATGAYQKALAVYADNPELLTGVLPDNFSIRETYKKREYFPDYDQI